MTRVARTCMFVVLCMGLPFQPMPCAYAAPNPVLPGTADAGVIRFNGNYYLMGVHTDGAFYVSSDLVQWAGPYHAFSMDNAWATGAAGRDSEIHACDIVLHNGVFHLYWSVNHGELRNIGRAVSDTILGPYHEPAPEAPFDGRIDPQLFVDDDGACYFYTVKFGLGNLIFGQPMENPATRTDKPVRLLHAVPGTWELRDHPVNEAQWVIRYRDRYYMLYNANHTGLEYGNYGIGCAEADGPLAFTNDTKYPFPILRDNWDRIHKNARVLSPLSRDEGVAWRYIDTAPSADWAQPDFDDGAWDEAEGAFGNKAIFMLGGTLRTQWDSDGIWLRRWFTVNDSPPEGEPYVFINHDADAEVYINGVLACRVTGFAGGYRLMPVLPEAARTLRPGANLMAVRCDHDDLGAQFIDAGLYLFQPGTAEPVVMNCGQPSVVRGPNGFEWWMVYFAVYDGDPQRGQAIDRVHFFDRELVMMPPVTAATPGTWHLPAKPTFRDFFENPTPDDGWRIVSGDWDVDKDTLVQTAAEGTHTCILDVPHRAHYLFEAGIYLTDNNKGEVGLVAWEDSTGRQLVFGFDHGARAWFWQFDEQRAVTPLPDDFNWTGWRMLRVFKNHDTFTLHMDNIPAPGNHTFTIPDAGPGRVGLFAHDSPAAFGSAAYTIGWDEYGTHIRGWGKSAQGAVASNAWTVTDGGVAVASGTNEERVFKGDLLHNFEWAVQVIPDGASEMSEYGVFALYGDEQNFLRLALNSAMRTLTITGMNSNVPLQSTAIPIALRANRLSTPEASGLNLRVVRRDGKITVFVDGIEAAHLPDTWPAAQVGLFARNGACRFNGITLFDRSSDDRP